MIYNPEYFFHGLTSLAETSKFLNLFKYLSYSSLQLSSSIHGCNHLMLSYTFASLLEKKEPITIYKT